MPQRIQRPKNAAEWKQLDAELASEKDEVMAAARKSKAAYDAIVPDRRDKGYRGDASQFFVAGELCRRRLVAVVTLGNCPNTDILCSNSAGTRFAHIQVKTFVPGNRTCNVGVKSERPYGENFFWVLGGIPTPESGSEFEYYIIPSTDMASNMTVCTTPSRRPVTTIDNPWFAQHCPSPDSSFIPCRINLGHSSETCFGTDDRLSRELSTRTRNSTASIVLSARPISFSFKLGAGAVHG